MASRARLRAPAASARALWAIQTSGGHRNHPATYLNSRFRLAFASRTKTEGPSKNMRTDMQRPIPEPPGHLSERSQALWRELVRYRCDSAERRILLECALSDLDRADALREQIAHEGVTVTSARSKLSRLNPGLRVENELRRRFLAAWRTLDLTWRERDF